MSDRFEEAVRDAVQGLPSTSGEIPTYHDAWHRGRRRRLIKRSAFAAAGALIFIAALTVNLGRIPGPGTTEVDDLATSLEVATAVVEPTPLATTPPIETPDPSSASSVRPSFPVPVPVPAPTDEQPADTAGAAASDPAPTLPPVQEPTATATLVPVQPAPTTAAPNPTAVPTATPAPTPTPTPVALPTQGPAVPVEADSADTGPVEPSVEGELPLPAETDPNQAADTGQQTTDPGLPDGTPSLPQLAFTDGGPVDAVILAEQPGGNAIPCDIDGDLVADATCELLLDYACTGAGDVRPGYTALDTNGDQLNDTCIAIDVTRCDTTFDGVGDTPCIIELITPSG